MWKTAFINNSADVGGALQISGSANLFNSSLVDNTSGEGGGPAIFNAGVISEMVGVNFSGNGYHCSPDAYMGLDEVRRVCSLHTLFLFFVRWQCLSLDLGMFTDCSMEPRSSYAENE